MRDIDNMPDPELTRMVAVEVMGAKDPPWKYQRGGWWWYDRDADRFRHFTPLTDANDRDMVVEAMFAKKCASQLTRTAAGYECRLIFLDVGNFQHTADTAGRAVCVAAIKAVMSAKEKV